MSYTRALLEDVDVRGCLITLDALHTTYETERAIVEAPRLPVTPPFRHSNPTVKVERLEPVRGTVPVPGNGPV